MRCEQRPVARQGLSIPGPSEHVGAPPALPPPPARPQWTRDLISRLSVSLKNVGYLEISLTTRKYNFKIAYWRILGSEDFRFGNQKLLFRLINLVGMPINETITKTISKLRKNERYKMRNNKLPTAVYKQ